MKRWILVILMIVAAVSSCMKERADEVYAHDPDFPEGKPLTISFSLPGMSPATKALDDGGELNNLYLAVFGSSGYLKEYVQAIPTPDGTYTYEVQAVDGSGNPMYDEVTGDPIMTSHTVPRYKFTATLAMTESARHIHFIGNGPASLDFGYDTAVLPVLMSYDGEKAYWQTIFLEHGIRAKKNNDGKYIDKDGNVLPEGATTGYVPTDETLASFQGIVLIRNWVKIVLSALHDDTDPENESNFIPKAMAVVNVPMRGTIVPYSKETGGFVEDYQDMSFTDLSDVYKYPGNLPSGTPFNTTIPEKSAFETVAAGGTAEGVSPANGSVFLYERPSPSSSIQPSYVIVYGYFDDPDKGDADGDQSGNYFYKVDLMETSKTIVDGVEEWVSKYYPLYRNFKYQIVINKILSRGQDTPAQAALSAGSADVSADINTAGITEISDGTARLHVSPWTAHTLTSEHSTDNPFSVLSVYFSKAVGATATGTVTAKLLDPEDGGEDLLYNLSVGAPDDDGWRPISFCNKAPGKVIRSQTIRVTGQYDGGRLYRDIVITVQGEQPLKVRCMNPYLSKIKGAEQTVQFMIPDGLMQSIFPLDFTIEAEDMTLTPDNSKPNNNLPVISGKSISDHDGYKNKTAFQFRRTITWDDYIALSTYVDSDESSWRVVNCYFKTNRAESATTVWVYNEFFAKRSDFFQNYGLKVFQNLTFTKPIPQETDFVLPITFEMEEDPGRTYPDDYPQILFTAIGLICRDPGVSPGPMAGSYYYTPTTKKVTLDFITTTDNGDISLDLSAEEYNDARLVPCHFSDVGFVDGLNVSGGYSNVILGYVNANVGPAGNLNANKTVLFAYRDDPLQPFTPVTLRLGSDESFSDHSTYLDANTPKFPYVPAETRSVGDLLYHEIPIRSGKTINLNCLIAELSSPGYVTTTVRAGRFKADNNPMEGSSLKDKIKVGNTTATLSGKWNGNYKSYVSIPSVRGSSGGVQLEAGKKHVVNITTNQTRSSSETPGDGLYLVRFTFAKKNNKFCAPARFLRPADGSVETNVEKYMGNDDQYLWHLSGGSSASIILEAPDDREICISAMVVWDYREATFYNP